MKVKDKISKHEMEYVTPNIIDKLEAILKTLWKKAGEARER